MTTPKTCKRVLDSAARALIALEDAPDSQAFGIRLDLAAKLATAGCVCGNHEDYFLNPKHAKPLRSAVERARKAAR